MYTNTTDFSTMSAPASITDVPAPESPSLTTVNATLSEPQIRLFLPNTQPPSGDPFLPTPSASDSLRAPTTADVPTASTNHKRSAPDTADEPLPGPSKRRRKPTEKAVLYAASMKFGRRRKSTKSAAIVDSGEENEWEDI